MKGVLIQHW